MSLSVLFIVGDVMMAGVVWTLANLMGRIGQQWLEMFKYVCVATESQKAETQSKSPQFSLYVAGGILSKYKENLK